MARGPQQRAPQASAEDDFYGEDELDQGQPDALGEERDDYDETGGAAEHAREGDSEFEEENDQLGDEDPPPPRRGEGRIQRLANENRDLRRRLDDYEQRRPDQAPQPPPGPRQETDQEFAARISLLSPEERLDAKFDRFSQQQAQQQQRTQLDTTLQRDRDDFRALARTDKRVARLADEVEREFDKRFRAGFLVPRRDILKWLVGQRWLDGDEQPGRQRAREAARQRVDRQTVRPSSGGSDVRANRRERTDERTARARRLDGVQI